MDGNMPKIGGITIERILNSKNDASKPIEPSDSDEDDDDFEPVPFIPPGLSIEKKKPNLLVRPNIQIPSGIQIQKKQDVVRQSKHKMLIDIPQQQSAQPFQSENVVHNLVKQVEAMENEDKQCTGQPILPNIQLPPGISFEKKRTSFEESEKAAPSAIRYAEVLDESDGEEKTNDSYIDMISDPVIEPKSEDKDVVKDLVEMMTKGEIEGEMEEEDKKVLKRKANDDDEEGDDEDEGEESGGKKKKLEDDDDDDEDSDTMDKSKVTNLHLRKNIREVMDETKLDETTIEAQRQEAERLKRLQEQRERQNLSLNLLSLIRQNAETSILKKTMSGSSVTIKEEPNQILMKMGNGQETSLSEKMRELLKAPGHEDESKNLLKQVSSSVTILPVGKKESDDYNVVTLSSDSDDDCVVISENESVPETEEDPANSGLHTSDQDNVPDEHGRVLVNTGHPPDEPDVFLAPQIAKVIKPHQVGGIRFLYDNIIESQSRYDSSTGFGCILAHSMGLGKTLQIVTFSDIFLRHTSGRKILVIMPINTIQNWFAEYNMWLPKENVTDAEIRCREFDIHVVNESSKNIQARAKVILDWHRNGGVLLMGYELFRLLSLRKTIKSKRKRPDDAENDRNRALADDIYSALVKPGPDLVICDEGHRIKNSHATTSQALKNIHTLRRIVLTGYPLQNNLLEYWCMVDFVRPNYLGSRTEFSNMFERPIQNGQCIDSTPQDRRLMRYRAHVLHSLLEGFVQRRSHAVLQEELPQKQEYVLLLRFTEFQKKLYDTFMNDVVRTTAVPNPLKAFAVCCKIWNHPDVLFHFLKKKGEQRDLDLEETLPPSRMPLDLQNQPSLWPKKGPGSRGGKIRQRKGILATNSNSPHHSGEKFGNAEQPLPSMSQFSIKSNMNRLPEPSNYSVLPTSNYPQPNPYQQSETSSYRQFDEYPENGPKSFNNSQFGSHSQKQPKTELENGDNFYKSPEPFPNSSQQYYPQNEPGFDFNQRPSDLHNEFSSYPDQQFDSSGFGSSSSIDFSQNSQTFWPNNSWPNTSQSGISGASSNDDLAKIETEDKREEKTEIKKDTDLPFDWATELFKNYVTGMIGNSSKMEIFFLILTESILKTDRLLVFSQSLLTLDLIEDYLQKQLVPGRDEKWCKNRNYFRLDGSTPALEREKLINEFNSNPNVGVFLVSTRAGSLGINLVGANRVVVFDASWNPCHDTQAVCRVYRYGQQKPCFVYRLVMDCCLEKKIYDRQINKQGMADRVVDELNPDAHLSLKDVTNLCWDDQSETAVQDFSHLQDKYSDDIVKKMVQSYGSMLSKAPFQHESLLIDRKEKKLSLAEKRLAKRGYELEKQAANQPRSVYPFYQSGPGPSIRGLGNKPVASVKPMLSERHTMMPPHPKWIPVEVWQKQGMSAQEITLPLDVHIPTSTANDKKTIVLNAGQRVMVLKSHKGVYMQLESGKIIAIRSAKPGQVAERPEDKKTSALTNALKSNPSLSVTQKPPPQQPPKSIVKPLERHPILSPSPVKPRINLTKPQQRIPRTYRNNDNNPSAQDLMDNKRERNSFHSPRPGTSRDLVKESLSDISVLTEATVDVEPKTNENNSQNGAEPLQMQPNYPMDPYGNPHPGYSRYGYPMPGYDGYHYPRVFPANDATSAHPPPPPSTTIYPPYPPIPYHYPYNYPPHAAAAGAPIASEPGNSQPSSVPPIGPRPPYPTPNPPSFYPNHYGSNFPGYFNQYMGPPPLHNYYPVNNTQPETASQDDNQS